MARGESNSPKAQALREAGYRKLPNWWVTQEQYELIVYMCEGNLKDIERIKRDSEQ